MARLDLELPGGLAACRLVVVAALMLAGAVYRQFPIGNIMTTEEIGAVEARGGLTSLQLDQEAQTDTSRRSQLILT